MTKIITNHNRKGGVGKSTSTLNLAHVLAEQGNKVLIIDLDDQQNTTRSISQIVKSEKTIEDLLLKDNIGLNDVSVKTEWKNVWILPSSNNLSGTVKVLNGELGGHLILKEKLKQNNNFDFILLDTSPSMNIFVINSLCASDYMLIPLNSKYFSMQGLQQTMDSFNKVTGRLNPDLKLLGIAFVNHDKRNVLANEVVHEIANRFCDKIFSTIIGINIKIEEAQVQKQSILTYASDDRGALQYRKLGKEILQRIQEQENE